MNTRDTLFHHRWLPESAREWLLLAAIVLLAGLLRLQSPGVVEFKRDEAALSLLALDMADGQGVPLLGIGSSVGIPNAPVSAWVLALPYAVSHDPTIATAFAGLLNVGAVLGVYLLARRCYGLTAAVVAALALACAPWAVIYSRKLWAQDLLPPFLVAAFMAGAAGLLEGRRWGQFLFLPLLALAGQLHFAAVVVLPAAALLVWFGRRTLTRWFWLGAALAVLLFVPYAAGLARAGLLDPAALAALRGGSAGPPADALASLRYAWLTVTGADLHSLAGSERYTGYLALLPDLSGVFALAGLGLLAPAGWLLARALRRKDSRARLDAVLLVWAGAAPLIFLVPWTPVYPHYFIPILPACALLAGAAAGDAVQALKGSPAGRVILGMGGAALALIFAAQVWAVVALIGFLGANSTPGGFGVPLERLAAVRDAILADAPQDVIVSLDDPDAPIVWRALLYDAPSLRFEGDGVRVYPAGEAVRLEACAEGDSSGFALRPGEGCLSIVPAEAFDETGWTAVEAMPFANGAQVGYLRWNADSACLDLAWSAAGPVDADYHFAVQFLDAFGAQVANADALGWPGRYWRAGDLITRSFCADAASAAQSVRLGMYTYADTPAGRVFTNADVLDAAGAPAGQQVILPLVEDG